MATVHALERATERIGLVLDADTVAGIVAKTDRIAAECTVDTAIRVWRLHRMVGQAWSDQSNGDDIIAIVRQGIVQTFMFRRSTQPHTPDAYGVRKVRG